MPSLKAANKVSSEIKTCHQTEDVQKPPGHEGPGVIGGIWGLLIPYLSRCFWMSIGKMAHGHVSNGQTV